MSKPLPHGRGFNILSLLHLYNKYRDCTVMNNPNAIDNLNPFEKGQSGNPAGRPKGSRNRATVARQWLEVVQKLKNPLTNQFEDLEQQDLMTLALIKKAREGDVAAYKALMDSGYGMPTQSVEVSEKNPIFSGIDLSVKHDENSPE